MWLHDPRQEAYCLSCHQPFALQGAHRQGHSRFLCASCERFMRSPEGQAQRERSNQKLLAVLDEKTRIENLQALRRRTREREARLKEELTAKGLWHGT